MAHIFGVANHSPEYVVDALKKGRLIATHASIGIVPVESLINKRPLYTHLLFLTTKDLRRNQETILSSKYANVKVFVLANPMDLSEIEGIIPLDFEANPEYPGFGFQLKTFNIVNVRRVKDQASLEYRKGRYLSKLIRYVKRGSLLNPLMTYLYTLPTALHNFVKEEIARWFMSGKSNHSLLSVFAAGSVPANVQTRITSILFNEIGERFKVVFSHVRQEGSEDLKRVAKENQVSDYEVRYLLSVLSNSKTSKFSSSFERARNRKKS